MVFLDYANKLIQVDSLVTASRVHLKISLQTVYVLNWKLEMNDVSLSLIPSVTRVVT